MRRSVDVDLKTKKNCPAVANHSKAKRKVVTRGRGYWHARIERSRTRSRSCMYRFAVLSSTCDNCESEGQFLNENNFKVSGHAIWFRLCLWNHAVAAYPQLQSNHFSLIMDLLVAARFDFSNAS